ncbi:MAG: DUF488 domain-containing protein [Candidatus Micrarchaeaceae archaeon]
MVLLGIRRVYEKRSPTDGKLILVDRLWPRGLRKSTNQVDLWLKDVAPSNELRKWFAHDPSKWEEFKKRYWQELNNNAKFKELVKSVKNEDVTLVYAARDTEHNDAVALAEFIKQELEKSEEQQ